MIGKLNYSRKGNLLQLKASDYEGNIFYSKVINLNNKNDVEQMKEDLKAKGCNFPVRWLE